MWTIIAVLTLLLIAASCARKVLSAGPDGQPRDCLIIAHRAGAGLAPENSLRAVRRAMELGVDAIEIDVRLTADGELVVCHDATIERSTNGRGRVDEMSIEELRQYRIVDAAGEATDEPMPTLGDVLWAVQGRTRVLIEAKRTKDAEQMAKALINEIALYGASEWVAVQSFDDEVLEHIHRLGHPCELEKLFYFKLPLVPFAYDGGLVRFSMSKYDYISSFNFNYKNLSPRLVERVHSYGKKIKVWTLDAPPKKPLPAVDGVITDRPDLWKKEPVGPLVR